MEGLKTAASEFMEETFTCPLWIITAVAVVVFFFILIPLMRSRKKWKKKFREIERTSRDEVESIRSKAEKDTAAAKKAAETEAAKARAEAEDAMKAARAEADRFGRETDEKMAQLAKMNELELVEQRELTRQAVAAEREAIRAEEAELAEADEKQLLVKTMMALSGYGTRLDRMEETLDAICRRMKFQKSYGISVLEEPEEAKAEEKPAE